jgi:hypothetical protein
LSPSASDFFNSLLGLRVVLPRKSIKSANVDTDGDPREESRRYDERNSHWLDAEKIQPVVFKTVVGQAGIGFEISFRHEQEGELFQQRFACSYRVIPT